MSMSPRKLIATADLHYGLYAAGDLATDALARHVCGSDADVLVLAGDIGGPELDSASLCLELFAGFGGLRLLVPGNHDLWTSDGDSLDRYRVHLPHMACKFGFEILDGGPVVRGETAFIGNIGWYDYSFRNPELGFSTADYQRKSIPGVCSWNDGAFVHWDMTDEEFTRACASALCRHYRLVERKVGQVVAVLHHVPFVELLYGPAPLPHEFCRAYMGSSRLGRLLARCGKVRYVICGHRHGAAAHQTGPLKALVAGSDYETKRLVELDLATGAHAWVEFPPPP